MPTDEFITSSSYFPGTVDTFNYNSMISKAFPKEKTMNYAIVCCIDDNQSNQDFKDRLKVVPNNDKHIQSAINELKSYSKTIYVFEAKEIYKVISKPEFKKYSVTDQGEILPT